LPIYADAMAHDLATPKAPPQFVGDHRILQYLDLSAIVGDVTEELSSNGGDDQLSNSSHSASSGTFASHSHSDCSESSASDIVD
jgi:hypothetical protein